MRFCIYCGAKHADDDIFCPNCGQKIVDMDAFEKELAIPHPKEKEEPEEPKEIPVEETVSEEIVEETIEEPEQEEAKTPVEELSQEEALIIPEEEVQSEPEPKQEEKVEKDLKIINILLVFISILFLVGFYGLAYNHDNFHFLILGSALTALINLVLSIVKKIKKKAPTHKLFYSTMIVINLVIMVGDLLFFLEYIR